jgi:hypothetical protein
MLAATPIVSLNGVSKASAQGYDNYNYYSDDSYSQYPTDDKKYECRTGPFEGFFVSSVEFCKHIKFDKDDRKDNRDNKTGPAGPRGPPGPSAASNDTQIICEECIKYWLHFLNTGGVNDLIEGLIDAINEVNFGEPACTPPPVNTLPGVECLTQGSPSSEQTYAQLFEICEQLDLALRYLVSTGLTPQAALDRIETLVLADTPTDVDRIVIGLFDCFAEDLLPVLFPDTPPPGGISGPVGISSLQIPSNSLGMIH